jgi:hypothetical protein
MKFTRTLIFTAFILIFSIPALCQKSAALTASTADRIISLFEFALDGEFNRNQREAFTRELAEQWKSDANSVASYTKLLEIYEQVQALPADKQREAQAQFQQTLLAELQKNPTNPRNRILIAVYKQSHGGDFNEPVAQTELPDNVSGSVPPQFVGRWITGSSSALTYSNSTTGASDNASGIQVLYAIQPNGRYEYATLETHTMYSCTTKLQTYKTGHIEMNGSQLTFVPESGTFTSEDSCNRQYNYTKPAQLNRETFAASVQRDEYGTKLCLVGNGINGCAYKRD